MPPSFLQSFLLPNVFWKCHQYFDIMFPFFFNYRKKNFKINVLMNHPFHFVNSFFKCWLNRAVLSFYIVVSAIVVSTKSMFMSASWVSISSIFYYIFVECLLVPMYCFYWCNLSNSSACSAILSFFKNWFNISWPLNNYFIFRVWDPLEFGVVVTSKHSGLNPRCVRETLFAFSWQ